MSRGSQSFKQGDITKAVKGAVRAGMKVARVEVVDGKIIVIAGSPETGEGTDLEGNEWDDVK